MLIMITSTVAEVAEVDETTDSQSVARREVIVSNFYEKITITKRKREVDM